MVKLGTIRPPISVTSAAPTATASRSPSISSAARRARLLEVREQVGQSEQADQRRRPAGCAGSGRPRSRARRRARARPGRQRRARGRRQDPVQPLSRTARRPEQPEQDQPGERCPRTGRRPVQFGIAVSRKAGDDGRRGSRTASRAGARPSDPCAVGRSSTGRTPRATGQASAAQSAPRRKKGRKPCCRTGGRSAALARHDVALRVVGDRSTHTIAPVAAETLTGVNATTLRSHLVYGLGERRPRALSCSRRRLLYIVGCALGLAPALVSSSSEPTASVSAGVARPWAPRPGSTSGSTGPTRPRGWWPMRRRDRPARTHLQPAAPELGAVDPEPRGPPAPATFGARPVLETAGRIAELTGGAFDTTVQPLWRLYADHFTVPAPDPAGPPSPRESRLRSVWSGHAGWMLRPARCASPGPAWP